MMEENGNDALVKASEDTDTGEVTDVETIDETDAQSQNRIRLPVVPLRGMVVFPAVAAPIAAGRDKTMLALSLIHI